MKYDVIIIGGSFSGLSAAMTLGRALRNVVIVDSGDPCNKQTPYSHNFLTNDGKSPIEITRVAREQVVNYNTVKFLHARAIGATKKDNAFEIEVESGQIFVGNKLIIATGIKDLMPDIPGFSDCWGITVLHCPYCHGYEVRNQKTGIIANGDDAFEQASLISNWTSDLTIYTNGPSTLSVVQSFKLQQHNISIDSKKILSLEHKGGIISNIIFEDKSYAPVTALYSRLPFVQHSNIPGTLGCELTTEGYIKINNAQQTTVSGVYACGDNSSRMRTVANAVSMGTTAGIIVNKELIQETF